MKCPAIALLMFQLGCREPAHDLSESRAPSRQITINPTPPAPVMPGLRLRRPPSLQPGFALGEKLQWLREDISVVCELEINADGRVSQVRVRSSSPPDNAAAQEFASFVAGALRGAIYEIPPGLSTPVVSSVTVRVPASRDASGRLK